MLLPTILPDPLQSDIVKLESTLTEYGYEAPPYDEAAVGAYIT
jgi:hypothetical protein